MEDLFSVQLPVNGRKVAFKVVFDQEQYNFLPDNAEAGRFFIRRVHDEWQVQENVSDELRVQAVEALDRYLLKQH